VPQDNYYPQRQQHLRVPSPHGAPTAMPTAGSWRTHGVLCRGWLWRIQGQEPCLIVCLETVGIAHGLVHDRGNDLPTLVGMLQAEHMPQLVEDNAAHIQEHGQLPMAECVAPRAIIGIPAERRIQDSRGAPNGEAPVGHAILLLHSGSHTAEVLTSGSVCPSDHIGRIGLLDQKRHNRCPLRKGRGRVVIPTGRAIQESAPGVAQLQADGNRDCRPHQRHTRALVLDG
jgi:hypothetical protein